MAVPWDSGGGREGRRKEGRKELPLPLACHNHPSQCLLATTLLTPITFSTYLPRTLTLWARTLALLTPASATSAWREGGRFSDRHTTTFATRQDTISGYHRGVTFVIRHTHPSVSGSNSCLPRSSDCAGYLLPAFCRLPATISSTYLLSCLLSTTSTTSSCLGGSSLHSCCHRRRFSLPPDNARWQAATTISLRSLRPLSSAAVHIFVGVPPCLLATSPVGELTSPAALLHLPPAYLYLSHSSSSLKEEVHGVPLSTATSPASLIAISFCLNGLHLLSSCASLLDVTFSHASSLGRKEEEGILPYNGVAADDREDSSGWTGGGRATTAWRLYTHTLHTRTHTLHTHTARTLHAWAPRYPPAQLPPPAVCTPPLLHYPTTRACLCLH